MEKSTNEYYEMRKTLNVIKWAEFNAQLLKAELQGAHQPTDEFYRFLKNQLLRNLLFFFLPVEKIWNCIIDL